MVYKPFLPFYTIHIKDYGKLLFIYHYYRYDQDGNEEYPIFPFKVALKPTGKINFSNVKLPDDCYIRQFTENIQDGTELYSFIAYADPQDVNTYLHGRVGLV